MQCPDPSGFGCRQRVAAPRVGDVALAPASQLGGVVLCGGAGSAGGGRGNHSSSERAG